MHATQTKAHEASTATKAVETESKATLKATDATRLPAWALAWEDRPPIGLFGADASAPIFQAKLAISQPDDPFEREADRVAEQVMRMPDPAMPVLQRKPG